MNKMDIKFDKTTIAKILDAKDLIEFIAVNRYRSLQSLESEEFRQFPEWVKDIIFILDFETEYEMQGLLTFLVNSTGHYLPEIMQSFKRSNNNNIADLLKKLQDTLSSVGLSPDILRNSEDNLSLEDYPEIIEKIKDIDDKLRGFIEEKEFWGNVTVYVQRKIDSGC